MTTLNAYLERIQRASSRLRSAEAQVAELRLALDREIALVIDSTRLPVSAVAEAAGKSRQAVYAALERADRRRTLDESSTATPL